MALSEHIQRLMKKERAISYSVAPSGNYRLNFNDGREPVEIDEIEKDSGVRGALITPTASAIADLCRELIYKAETENPGVFVNKRDLTLYIPDIAIHMMIEWRQESHKDPSWHQMESFMGIKVTPGYELAIVLAHKDFHFDLARMVFRHPLVHDIR